MALEYCSCMIDIRNSFYSRCWSIPSFSTKHILSVHGSVLLDSIAVALKLGQQLCYKCRWRLPLAVIGYSFFPIFWWPVPAFLVFWIKSTWMFHEYIMLWDFSTNQQLHGHFQHCQVHSKTCSLSRDFPIKSQWSLHWGNWNGGLIASPATLKDTLILSY